MPTNYLHRSFVPLLFCCIAIMGTAQTDSTKAVTQSDSSLTNLSQKQIDKYTSSINKKASSVSNKLEKTNHKALSDLQNQEQKFRKKLSKVDSSLAKQLFDKPNQQLEQLTNKVQHNAGKLNKLRQLTVNNSSKEYLPLLDTFKTSLKFLDTKLVNNSLQEQTNKALSSIKGLESQLQNATDIKAYIKQRKAELTTAFDQYGMGKQLQSLNKQAYYYGQQVNEYKQLLKDPKKLEERAIAELTKSSLFKDFMQHNSQLASLFPMPQGYGTAAALNGLQTSGQIQALISQRLGSIATTPTSSGGNNYLQQQVQAAQSQLDQLKDKAIKIGNPSLGNGDVPDFKPNSQHTKSFFKRLEYGFNVQNGGSTVLLPATSDIGLSLGYKFNDKMTAGVGASYKLGYGTGFNDIHFSSQGAGLRGYMDVKAKGSIWVTGGWEYNYFQAFAQLNTLYNIAVWQKSALIGLTKKYKVGKTNGNIQLLYNLLAPTEIPRSFALKFRIGYSF